ncbi:hypothetical protein B0H16DRAFT_1686895 [Mycena metata]|uniref:Uncharacterized protein n=1 Tax=Mycena metata TaxID=1033252 RepID=A0AAD7JLH0_9AGAR|nr:hypothetical protein B0H16DRAFT_1686895 [Mycena metata]
MGVKWQSPLGPSRSSCSSPTLSSPPTPSAPSSSPCSRAHPPLANTSELALSTLAATFALFRRTLNLEAKVNQQWSQELGAAGRLTIQSVLGCCGYFSPGDGQRDVLFAEYTARVQAAVFGVSGEGVDEVVYSIMAAGLPFSNNVTYRFGKGIMPKAYRLSREAMAVIMEQYASQLADQYGADAAAHMIANNSGNTGPRAQTHTRGSELSGLSGMGSGGGGGYIIPAVLSRIPYFDSIPIPFFVYPFPSSFIPSPLRFFVLPLPTPFFVPFPPFFTSIGAQMPPNPFSPNPTPAASASDLNLTGPRPHQDEEGDEEGDGYSYGYGGVDEGDERGAGGQHAKYESLDIGAARQRRYDILYTHAFPVRSYISCVHATFRRELRVNTWRKGGGGVTRAWAGKPLHFCSLPLRRNSTNLGLNGRTAILGLTWIRYATGTGPRQVFREALARLAASKFLKVLKINLGLGLPALYLATSEE